MSDLIGIIKKAALDAVENTKPMAVMFGVVKEIAPIEISIEQKFTLGEKELIFLNETKWLRETTDKRNIGKKVMFLRMQGGQRFIVMEVME